MTQRTSKELILDSLFLKFESEIARARAELMIYLSNPAGIGEHSEIVEEIEKKVKKIADSASYHETLKQLSSPSENNEEVDTTSKNERIVVKVKMDENLTDAEKQFFADVQLMRGSSGASGYDLCTLEGGTLQAGETKVFRTGVFLEIPPGFEGQVRSRSGWALKGVVAANSPGTIDSDYRGEIKVLLYNQGNIDQAIEAQSRIAQIVFCKVETPYFHFTNVLTDTQRSENGLGSTGL